ncbi:beta-Ala-His dipeptidase [Finegoldia sp. BIOML-A2]|uniref:beta-Ala-His dipeptidase n=1 Tax=unclassified Finegoldia TaxID=2619637 RepID=UPI0013261135|nr:beta-Ala-His dipeptidase [Finegoldia sp. BIOML-A5]MSB00819.1 beta-Ala-His dipeptidase [Finegoldia sp. BIOML-A2]
MDKNTVLNYFRDFSKINRCSKHEQEIADYLEKFAHDNDLECKRDKFNNIYIKRESDKSLEDKPGIILQAHMDMVCVSDEGYDFDNGIKIIEKDGFMFADKTSLGADNGIGLAIAMATLTSNHKLPQIEAVVTTSEEVDMSGAMNFDFDLSGKYFINIDSEDENELIVGSSGGENVNVEVDKHYVSDSLSNFYKISVKGLKGGHSGMEIDKNHQNAIKVLFEFLKSLDDYYICDFKGGTKDNAIPTNAELILSTDESVDSLSRKSEEFISKIDLEDFDKDLKLVIEQVNAQKCLDKRTTENLSDIIGELNSGVISYIEGLDETVETSCNLAIVNSLDDKFEIILSTRSSNHDKLVALREDIVSKANKHNATAFDYNYYPTWEFNEKSELMEVAKNAFSKVNDKEVDVKVIHAGLECGVFAEKYKKIDCISIGPTMYDVHTTKERLDIESLERFIKFYNVILNMLTN